MANSVDVSRLRKTVKDFGADAWRAVFIAITATIVMAQWELIATAWETRHPLPYSGLWRLAATTLTLSTIVGVAFAICALAASWLFRSASIITGIPTAGLLHRQSSAWAKAFCSGALAALMLVASSPQLLRFIERKGFQDPKLEALITGAYFAVLAAVAVGLSAAVVWAVGRILHRLPARLRPALPTERLSAAIAWALCCGVVALLVWRLLSPSLRGAIIPRKLYSLLAFAAGAQMGMILLHHGAALPRCSRRRWFLSASALLALAIIWGGLTRWGGSPAVKSHLIASSPTLLSIFDKFQAAHDWDKDGYATLLGGNDCAPRNPAISPGVLDIPGNGIDEDCDGKDAKPYVPPKGLSNSEIPADFKKNWNILLISVDTLRYDHTGFGGYKKRRQRDTTPHLDKFVRQSISFTDANAPSPGTMGTMPALLTSKFFHSGIALEEFRQKNGKRVKVIPPKLTDDNLLLGEIMKQAGYKTGAITSHYYFRDWGMNQGIDDYDNSIGSRRDPWQVSSHLSTQKALGWIASNASKKWFLWVHYIDPHGRYVKHPEYDFGGSELDKYNSELRYTDEHIGKLLSGLAQLPGRNRTIVILTSDHGDAFGEHGEINHGHSLYWELLHVPLIIHIPGLPPRQVEGPVSPIDIVPTLADIIGYRYQVAQFEGSSLVPQLFHGKDAKDRVVFAETNYPKKQRAIISHGHKLIYRMERNHYEFYDRHQDPGEKQNIASKRTPAFKKMKDKLFAWRNRVLLARDATFNQMHRQLADTRLSKKPKPKVATNLTFAGGTISLLGYTAKWQKGKRPKLEVDLYFEAKGQVDTDYAIEVGCYEASGNKRTYKSRKSLTKGGVFPTRFWRPGEYVRDTRSLYPPQDKELECGVRLWSPKNEIADFTGNGAESPQKWAILGRLKPEAGSE